MLPRFFGFDRPTLSSPPLPRPRRRPPRPFPGENAARASTRLYARSVLKSDLSELARSLGHRAASAS